MTMTDPIADMLTRIRNANVALHDKVRMPSSKQKEALARILQQEGYIQGFDVIDDAARPGKVLTISMKYTPERSAHDLRSAPRVEAGSPRLLAGEQGAACARGSGHRCRLHRARGS